MLTAVDHIVMVVTDVERAVATYRHLGFTVTGGENRVAHAVFGDLYLQFQESDETTYRREGLEGIVLRSDDLDAEVARLRSSGVSVTDPADDPIDGEGGALARRRATVEAIVPIGLVEHRHDPVDRISYLGGAASHPNNATTLERVYLAVESMERELEPFARLLGIPAPEPEFGTVIMSLMSVLYIGTVGIAVAEPRGPGPTADALSTNGPGLFQVLFRADHLDEAAQLMVDNGVPSPARGTRLSGESALLVAPANACNVYVGLAGPP